MAEKNRSVKQLQSILKKLERSVGESLKREALEPVGDFLVKLMQKRIRLGYQIPGSLQDKSKFQPLSEKYIKWRKERRSELKKLQAKEKRARKSGKYGKAAGFLSKSKGFQVSPFFSPARSNLHLTGIMIDSLKSNVQRSTIKNGIIEIKPEGMHHGDISNADLAKWHNDGIRNKLPARPFLFISRLEFKQTVRFYRKTFGDLLRRRNVL